MLKPFAVLVTAISVILLGLVAPASADETTAGKSAVHFLVDTSGSMGGSKIAEAKASLLASTTALQSSGAVVGLREFSGSCSSPGQLLLPIGEFDAASFESAVNGLSAGGGTPTSAALRLAAQDFPDDVTNRTLVLIADGDDGCGDLCVTAQSLIDEGVNVRIQTVGIQVGSSAASSLACAAEATGGEYFSVDDLDDLSSVIGAAVGQNYDYNGDGLVRVANLGDSYSSGEGIRGLYSEAYYDCGTDLRKGKYLEGTNLTSDYRFGEPWPDFGCQTVSNQFSEPTDDWRRRELTQYENKCHRSGTAYGPLMWDELGVEGDNGLFVACSGAKAKNVVDLDVPGGVVGSGFGEGQYPKSPYGVAGANLQIVDLDNFSKTESGETKNPDIITLSLGGNDLGVEAGISEVMRDCSSGCPRNKLESRAKNVIPNFLSQTMRQLRSRYPDSRILMVGYPVLFGNASGGCGNLAGNFAISKSDRDWIDGRLIPLLNDAVRDAAARNGATYVDVYNTLGGTNSLCAEDNWINGLNNIGDVLTNFSALGHPAQRWHEEVAKMLFKELAKPSVDIQTACRIQYSNDLALARVTDEIDAFSWQCWYPRVKKSGVDIITLGGIDVDRACSDQYGDGWESGLGSTTDPYSWYCRK